MGTQTSRLALPYPYGSDADNVPSWLQDLADRLDSICVVYSSGPYADRPAPGNQGFVYIDTDNNIEWLDNGTQWVGLNQPLTIGDTPSGSNPGDAGSVGDSGIPADAFHVHARESYAGSGGNYGTTNTLARGDHTHTAVIEIGRDFVIGGAIAVASGGVGYIPPMVVRCPDGQAATLTGVRTLCRTGGVTVQIARNGTAVTGLSALAVSSSLSTTTLDSPLTLDDGDLLAVVVTAVSGTPDGMTVTPNIAYSVTAAAA